MKLAQLLPILVTAALSVPSALADFHVIQGLTPSGSSSLEACPSNNYNCGCMKNGDRAAQVIDVNGQGVGGLPNNSFSVKSGLCGMDQLDFYKSSDGHWDFYISNGDGTLQGKCHPNTASSSCSGGYFFDDKLVCYTDICDLNWD